MNIENLSPADVADWYRAQIKKYQRLLENHEIEFPSAKTQINRRVAATRSPNIPGLLTADTIKRFLNQTKKGYRIEDLAAAFDVGVDEIRAIVFDPASGLTNKVKGWVKVV